jgi:predicted transcriptional regulator
MKPDASRHNPDPRYLRGLMQKSGLTQALAAQLIGITEKALRNYISETVERDAPYAIQFALECLAARE